MKELREQIAEIIKSSNSNQWRTMKIPFALADKILSLKIETIEKCSYCKGGGFTADVDQYGICRNLKECPICKKKGFQITVKTLKHICDLKLKALE